MAFKETGKKIETRICQICKSSMQLLANLWKCGCGCEEEVEQTELSKMYSSDLKNWSDKKNDSGDDK